MIKLIRTQRKLHRYSTLKGELDQNIYKNVRKNAQQEVEKRNDYFKKSQEAYKCGNKELAKIFSNMAKIYNKTFEMENKSAAEKIFKSV